MIRLLVRIGRGLSQLPDWARPYPFEIVAYGGCAVAVLFLRSQGLRVDWRTVEYTVPPLIRVTFVVLLAGLPLQALYQWLVNRDLRGYLRRVLRPRWLFDWLRIWAVCPVFTYAYFWLKVSVPLVNWSLWDEQLWTLDRILHLGLQPNVLAVELFRDTVLLGPLDTWYGWWIVTTMYATAFFVAHSDGAMRRAFTTGYVTLWYLGAALYLSVPVLGPVYVYPDVWSDVVMPHARGAQAMLLENYQRVVAGRTEVLRRFNPTRGIAALPSLHVGIHAFFTLWMWRLARPLLMVGVVGTLLTFIGSVVTGWHYAVDGYLGVVLALGCFWLATRRPAPPDATHEAG